MPDIPLAKASISTVLLAIKIIPWVWSTIEPCRHSAASDVVPVYFRIAGRLYYIHFCDFRF